jgi:4-aminobutyrate aminotransferase
MRAIDVIDLEDGKPDHDLRDKVVDVAFYHGLLLLGCGEGALRFCPPLCIDAEQIDTCLQILDGVLAECAAEKVGVG